MADMLSMIEIKNGLRDALTKLGYSTRCKGLTDFSFEMQPVGHGHHGTFEIVSANIKRFEVSVSGRPKDFIVPSRPTESADWHTATVRFTKRADAIPEVLEWVSTALIGHRHLNEMLHPERPPENFFGFTEEGFMQNSGRVYYGVLSNVFIMDIVTLNGRRVAHTAYDPNAKPYFLAAVYIRPRAWNNYETIAILTDGDMWLPVRCIFDEHLVFMDEAYIAKLKDMNRYDRDLMHAALSRYVADNFSDQTTPSV